MIWALSGASTIASQYMIGALRAQQGGTVRWVVSGSEDHARRYAQSHNIPHSGTDLAAALEDPAVEAVYISSTNEKHHAQAMAAIAAGKHVLCEKPLALSVAEAAEMIAAARAAGVTLGVNHHLRHAGSHRAIREAIALGRLGRILSLRVFHAVHLPEHLRGWRLDNPAAGGGVIPDITVHNADTVRFLLQEDPASVIAESAVSGMGQGVEDSAMSVWSMPSGAMVFSHESFTHPHTTSGLEVHGTEGSLIARDVMAQDPKGALELITAAGRSALPFDTTSLYETAVRRFEAAARDGREASASGTDGLKSLMIALAVRDAAQSGTRQSLDYGVAS